MILLGLAGPAGSGKDTVADYLVERYGFIKFSFSDALYREVAKAFGLESEDLLRDRATKEVPTERLSLVDCLDDEFIGVAVQHVRESRHPDPEPLSPRQILQWWGTEFRRAQDSYYWTKRAHDWMCRVRELAPYPESRAQNFVNCSVRFEEERRFITDPLEYFGWDGNIWHLHRDTAMPVASHESETPLPVLDGEREIWNNHTLEYLRMGVDQLMSSNIPSIRVGPPEPMLSPEEKS